MKLQKHLIKQKSDDYRNLIKTKTNNDGDLIDLDDIIKE